MGGCGAVWHATVKATGGYPGYILDVRPAEDVAKKCARCGGIVGINQGVDAGDHQTELLKSPKS
ncbi:MAG: hypothetical protein WBW49_05485, partial [Candidatus Acidiferrum sp.]